ncbi:hypothetical protein [Streptomyces sp. NPDC002994]|uniref:hypothetical protein n=1 Tax=Streptomyces sp. NPDC002994 TaxID=3154441 RepID=UPI0033B9A045
MKRMHPTGLSRREDHIYTALLLLNARISGDEQTVDQIRREHPPEFLVDGLLEVGACLAPPTWGGAARPEPSFEGSEPGA